MPRANLTDQSEEQPDRQRGALADDPGAVRTVFGPHRGQPPAGEADRGAQREADRQHHPGPDALGPSEAAYGQPDDGVGDGQANRLDPVTSRRWLCL